MVVSKYAGILGITVGTYDVMLFTKAKGYNATLLTYLRTMVPVMASGVAFAAITCAATNYRGKDDKLNYFLGGASAGGVFGAAARSFKVGLPVAFAFGCLAALYKDSKEEGYELIPIPKAHKMGLMDWRKGDFTLMKDDRR